MTVMSWALTGHFPCSGGTDARAVVGAVPGCSPPFPVGLSLAPIPL